MYVDMYNDVPPWLTSYRWIGRVGDWLARVGQGRQEGRKHRASCCTHLSQQGLWDLLLATHTHGSTPLTASTANDDR